MGRSIINAFHAFPKKIYCPRCGRKVATWDGRTSMNIEANCRKCNKRIVYYPATDEVVRKDMPPRMASSGMRFF